VREWHRGRVEVEDARENLRREDGDRHEHVAARKRGEDGTLRSVDVLIDRSLGIWIADWDSFSSHSRREKTSENAVGA